MSTCPQEGTERCDPPMRDNHWRDNHWRGFQDVRDNHWRDNHWH